MSEVSLNIKDIFLPKYVLSSLKQINWIKKEEDKIIFNKDDLILIFYGTRGSTSFDFPENLKYGANTTSYHVFSPRIKTDVIITGDGGSGILELNKTIISKIISNNINPFSQEVHEREKIKDFLKRIIHFQSHYHYDHLATGLPIASSYHINAIQKRVIGRNPRINFIKTFKREQFPKEFKEMSKYYKFTNIWFPENTVFIILPNGRVYKVSMSKFNKILSSKEKDVFFENKTYNISDCLVVKTLKVSHPDPCLSYRYENYDKYGVLINSFVFLTDHELDIKDLGSNSFNNHINNSTIMYIDGQYNSKTYMKGYGHGRIEVIGEMSNMIKTDSIFIGHHSPESSDEQIDKMIDECRSVENDPNYSFDSDFKPKIFGASDRMMVFIPGASRKRTGMVIGRSSFFKLINKATEKDHFVKIEEEKHYEILDLTKKT